MSEFANFSFKLTPTSRNIALRLHQALLEINPDFEHKKAWGGYAYKSGSKYTCMIYAYPDHAKLVVWKKSGTKRVNFKSPTEVYTNSIQSLLAEQVSLFDYSSN